jgi:hypothetical protein
MTNNMLSEQVNNVDIYRKAFGVLLDTPYQAATTQYTSHQQVKTLQYQNFQDTR